MTVLKKIAVLGLSVFGLSGMVYVATAAPAVSNVLEVQSDNLLSSATTNICNVPFDTDYMESLESSNPDAFLFAGCGGQM